MQFMYLRRKGNNKNPGRHPIGLIGVQKNPDGTMDVAVQMAHSADRFVKSVGRELLVQKIVRDRSCRLDTKDHLELHTILPPGVARRLSNYTEHQEILDRIIKDEIWGGSWSTNKQTLVEVPKGSVEHKRIMDKYFMPGILDGTMIKLP